METVVVWGEFSSDAISCIRVNCGERMSKDSIFVSHTLIAPNRPAGLWQMNNQ